MSSHDNLLHSTNVQGYAASVPPSCTSHTQIANPLLSCLLIILCLYLPILNYEYFLICYITATLISRIKVVVWQYTSSTFNTQLLDLWYSFHLQCTLDVAQYDRPWKISRKLNASHSSRSPKLHLHRCHANVCASVHHDVLGMCK